MEAKNPNQKSLVGPQAVPRRDFQEKTAPKQRKHGHATHPSGSLHQENLETGTTPKQAKAVLPPKANPSGDK